MLFAIAKSENDNSGESYVVFKNITDGEMWLHGVTQSTCSTCEDPSSHRPAHA